ncbi:hypothetical protein Tco_0037533, partial [Tanacetum coccineum]
GLDDTKSVSPRINHFNAESDLVESLLNRDTSIDFSPKIDFLLEEFAGELAPIDPISPGIVEADFDPEEDIRLIENLLNDNSSPHSPEELNSEIFDVTIESFSPSHIPVKDSDSLREEIDTFLASDDSIPLGIDSDDYEGDFLKDLLNDDSISRPEYETFHFDRFNIPSSPRPPEKLPDDDGICFDTQPDPGDVAAIVVDDFSDNLTKELKVHVLNVLPTLPTFYLDLDFTVVIRIFLPFFSYSMTSSFLLSFGSEDTIFDPGISITF